MSRTGENMIYRVIREALNGNSANEPLDALAGRVSVRLHNSGFLLRRDRSGTERVVRGALQVCGRTGRRSAATSRVASVYSALQDNGLILRG